MGATEFTHGVTGYSHHKCRCPVCRSAVAEYNRKRQRAIREGNWQPGRYVAEKVQCTGPDCALVAKVKKPQPLCNGHAQQVLRGVELKPLTTTNRVVDGRKACSQCREVLPLSQYNTQGDRPTGKCKACTSIYTRALRYGVTFEEMQTLMGLPCAGCGTTDLTGRQLHIDHCHETGRLRGVLCRSCNLIVTDHATPSILRRLADYLEV